MKHIARSLKGGSLRRLPLAATAALLLLVAVALTLAAIAALILIATALATRGTPLAAVAYRHSQ